MQVTKLYLLAFLVFASTVFADDYDDYIQALKTTAGFSSWPGKGAALKRGLNFQPSGYSQLTGFATASDLTDTAELTFGIGRALVLSNGDRQLTIQIGVAFGSTDNAQELLLRTLAASQSDFSSSWQRGDPGLTVGDLNFVRMGGTASNNWGGAVAFVRNNVMCLINDENPSQPFTALASLAAAIDGNIQAQPNLTSVQFNALRPQVLQFSPASSTIASGGSTRLNISIVDPASDPFTIEVSTDGSLNVTPGDVPLNVTVQATGITGLIPINLLVVDASLLFSTAQTTVQVTP